MLPLIPHSVQNTSGNCWETKDIPLGTTMVANYQILRFLLRLLGPGKITTYHRGIMLFCILRFNVFLRILVELAGNHAYSPGNNDGCEPPYTWIPSQIAWPWLNHHLSPRNNAVLPPPIPRFVRILEWMARNHTYSPGNNDGCELAIVRSPSQVAWPRRTHH